MCKARCHWHLSKASQFWLVIFSSMAQTRLLCAKSLETERWEGTLFELYIYWLCLQFLFAGWLLEFEESEAFREYLDIVQYMKYNIERRDPQHLAFNSCLYRTCGPRQQQTATGGQPCAALGALPAAAPVENTCTVGGTERKDKNARLRRAGAPRARNKPFG